MQQTAQEKRFKVAIIGGGLVGSLSACYFAKRGHDVHLYEYREDIRKAEHVKGRSINLVLSTRAIQALKQVGLDDQVINHHGIPVKGRMIHNLDGSQYPIMYDPVRNQCIYSVSRRYLNEVLLTATEKFDNVKLNFNHKLINANLREGSMTFQMTGTNETLLQTSDLIVGADGAFSTVRKHLLKQPMFDYSQTYIQHGYSELCIPPREDGEFAMEPNYLHIWPRSKFMMIALPNQDRTWTVTLFLRNSDFEALTTPTELMKFFTEHFPDSIELIGKQRLVTDYFATKPSHLLSIKCRPYHLGSTAIIIGDAAHAMVPFYGQGINAGFEDCRLLDEMMVQYNYNLPIVLQEFSSMRNKDAEAICDLAMYNYLEMSDLVNRQSFRIRKKVDNLLYWLFPNLWIPLYQSVSFTDINYRRCVDNKLWQDKILHRLTIGFGALGSLLLLTLIYRSGEIFHDIQDGLYGYIPHLFF